MMRMMLASSLAVALIVTTAANAEASLEAVTFSMMATPGEDADALRPVRVLSELSSASSPIEVHTGNDYNMQVSAYTGQTVVWGASSDGLIFVENDGVVLYAIYDPEEAATGVDWNAAERGTVESPTECPDISSLFIDGGNESTLFFLKSNTLFCSCEWTESSKCPAVLSVKSVTTKRDEDKPLSTTTTTMNTTTELVVSGNSMVPILSVDPAITAPLSFSDPSRACEPLLNPAEVNGTICVTERGGCTFTLKYENCLEAGAVGALVVNTVDDFTTMPVTSVGDDFPYMFTTSSTGAALREIAAEAGGPSALSVSAGAGVGSSRALPGFSDGPALTAVALGSDSDVITLSGPNPFQFVEYASYDAGRDLLYLLCDNGNIHVVDIGDIVGGESGEYQVLGSFESMLGPSPLISMYIFSHPGAANGSASPVLVGAAPDGSGPGFYDISDPLVPELVSQLTLDTSFCPEAFTGIDGGLATIVGDGGYAYALPFYSGFSADLPDSCTGLEVDGVNYGNFPIAIYDIEDLGTPSLVGHFAVDALVNDPNDMRMVISRDGDVMAVVMQTNGVQFFDISEPTMPRPLSEVYTIETDGGLPFTEGVLDAKEGVPGQWFLLISQNGMTASILEVAIGELEATPGQEDDSLP